MKSVLAAALILLLPTTVMAPPLMGIYYGYTPGQMWYRPQLGESFNAYVYVHDWGCNLSAVEFKVQIETPSIIYNGFEIPEGSLVLGYPLEGVSITVWPPVSTCTTNHLFVCTVRLFAIDTCWEYDGSIGDAYIRIVPHPDSGGIYGTCWPENYMFDFIGLTSIICPQPIANEEASWGAIKGLFE
ncbi:MAG: hypothetical protein JSV33_11980 [bacterium]|nr:MAG: hypothetical protein JSV33_11980 [bacterium]